MTIQKCISELANELRKYSGVTSVHESLLPSGVADVGVKVAGRYFVIVYLPKEGGIGVDEVLEGEGFDTGYQFWFTDFAAARKKLLNMIDQAISASTSPSDS